MQSWLNDHQGLLLASERHLGSGASRSLLLTFFAATVAMPHVYHMLITGNEDQRALSGARWGFPLYLLFFSLCIPPILWAGKKLALEPPAEFFPVAIGLVTGNGGIAILAFIICLAAASGVLIVATIALASMTLNHILLPLYRPSRGVDIYSLLLNLRRGLIAAIILASFGVYQLFGRDQGLMNFGFIAFIAVLQFLPGLIGGFHWRRSNRNGLIAGLITGHLAWFSCLLLPLIYSMLLGTPSTLEISDTSLQLAVTVSLVSNTLIFVLFSMLTKPTAEETLAAQECMSDSLSSTFLGELQARSVSEMENNLAMALGRKASSREVNLALSQLSFLEDEHRPHALSQLRTQMEINLSSMLGQTIAHGIIGRVLPFKSTPGSVHALEGYLEDYRSQLTGLAAELDDLRRYHRQVLQDLPTAVCSVDTEQVIRTWNHAMQEVTGIETGSIVGLPITSLTEPWKDLLNTFIYDDSTHRLKIELELYNQPKLINLHKASIVNYPNEKGDLVIVIEDLTESKLIEEQLIHSERLASIGQFAAGIAHEIGNPVTGIACLAQNLKIDTDEPDLIELSNNILEQTERISNILQSLVTFAYSSKGDMKRPSVPVEIRVCINEAIKLLSLNQSEHEVMFTNLCRKDVYTLGDPQRLCQVFVNLLSNAQDASLGHNEVQIISRLEDDSVVIDIIDQGQGIPSNHLKRIFEPFFTTKDPGKGTGLGLAIVTTIIEEHHGSITAESTGESDGARVIIRLPQYVQGDSLVKEYTA